MDEILRQEDLDEYERYIPKSNPNSSDKPLRHVIASHRALQGKCDSYRQVAHDKWEEDEEFRKVAGADDHSSSYGMEPLIEIFERVKKERDELKRKLDEIENDQGLVEERRQFNAEIERLKQEVEKANELMKRIENILVGLDECTHWMEAHP